MNAFAPHALVPGVRFSLMNTEHEISFVDATMLRYSACKGGAQYRIPLSTFWKMVDDNSIGFLKTSADGSSISVPTPISKRLSDAAHSEMLRRYDYVKHVLEAPCAPLSMTNLTRSIAKAYEKHVEQAHKNGAASPDVPGLSTVARWVKLYVNSGGSPMALAPKSSSGIKRPLGFSLALENAISCAVGTYLSDNRPSVEQIYCNLVGMILEKGLLADGEKIPSRRTIYRRIEALDPYVKALKRHGKRIADSRFRAAGASFETTRAMQTVMIDGHHMDVIVIDKESGETLGRANLVCLFDVETRAVVGWYISLLPFCSSSALAAIKDMCSRDPRWGPGGVPEAVTPDNGRDLVSRAIVGLCSKIPMHFTPAKAYSPDDKAHLERFFRTLNEQLVHMIPGSTFSSPGQRGNYDSQSMACCTLDELRDLFRKWLDEVYHIRIHSGTSRAPLLAWRDCQGKSPVIHFSAEEIDVFARIPFRRTINNGRVLLDHLFYKSHVLATWEAQGKEDVVVLSDELDLSFVYVYHASDPENLVRADCTMERYAASLTKYEHDLVRAQMNARANGDRKEVGEYTYEIARWTLWNEIQEMKTQRAARQLARLKNQDKKKASQKRTASAPVPIMENEDMQRDSKAQVDDVVFSNGDEHHFATEVRLSANDGVAIVNENLDTFDLQARD